MKTLKILAVGNSFSVDAMEYLWDICKNGGFENITLGNLYIGGCSLDRHYGNIIDSTPDYTYYKNTNGVWENTGNATIQHGLCDEKWDIITMQQRSGYSGQPNTYTHLEDIIRHIRQTNPNAELYWHMTWAYQKDSTHSDFVNYDNDQLKMYNAITDTVQKLILSNKAYSGVIPCSTAVQNLRCKLGDTLTRDGFHMSYDYGRYTTALTWYAYLLKEDPAGITWIPSEHPHLKDKLTDISNAVKAAISTPFEVTE